MPPLAAIGAAIGSALASIGTGSALAGGLTAAGLSAGTAATVAGGITAATTAATIGTGIASAVKGAPKVPGAKTAALQAVPTTTSPEVQDMAALARRRAAAARGQSSTNIVQAGGTKLGQVGMG